MHKTGFTVVCVATAFAGAAHAGTDTPTPPKGAAAEVSYHLDPVMKDGALSAVELTIRFKADRNGRTRLDLPDHWGGGEHFYDRLKGLEITGATSVSAPKPARRMIVSKPLAPITVRYRIEANRTAGQEVPDEGNYSYPVVAPDWFYITAPGLIATVDGRDVGDVHFGWALPEGWHGATNLEYPLPKDMQTSADQAVLLAGKDVQIATLKVPSGELRVAWRGKFTGFDADGFNSAVSDIIGAEQAFWGEGQRHFLVTLAPTEPVAGRSIRGSGLGQSFAMVAAPDTDMAGLKIILAHEYFHSWNPVWLGGFDEDNEKAEYWFSEGFTDYYGRKLAYESKAVDAAQFMAAWNEALKAYASSPYRTTPNTIVTEKFWSDDQVQKLPYQRGSMLAAMLDTRWRAQGKSIDGFMHVLRAQAKADTAARAPHRPLMERLNRAAKAYGVDFGDLIDRYMITGEAMILPEDAFPGFRVVTQDLPVRDLGYDPDKSRAAGAFSGVAADGPAYAAGIREGMKRLKVDSQNGVDGRETITAIVEGADGKPMTISFHPEGKAMIHTQKLVALTN